MLLQINSNSLLYLALVFTTSFQSISGQNTNPKEVTNEDFVALKGKLQEYIAQDPDRRIPLLVRNSFHDLFLQDKGAIHGCIVKDAFKNDFENAGLDPTIRDLQNLVSENFPNSGFSFGDVIAFSGKIAAESAYPCINIKFKFNRSPCEQANPITANQAPSAFIDTIEGLGGTLSYMGGSISAEDMAILFAGAHGIKGARAGPSGWRGVFSTFSSGKDFIAKTFQDSWTFVGRSQGTLDQFFSGNTFNAQTSIIRLPSDMIFYPSKVPRGQRKDNSAQATNIESNLRAFTSQDRNVFDQAFARAYEKMLAIGDGNQDFVETVSTQACPAAPIGGNPGNPTTTQTTQSTTSTTTTSESTTSSSTTETSTEINPSNSLTAIISTTAMAVPTSLLTSGTVAPVYPQTFRMRKPRREERKGQRIAPKDRNR